MKIYLGKDNRLIKEENGLFYQVVIEDLSIKFLNIDICDVEKEVEFKSLIYKIKEEDLLISIQKSLDLLRNRNKVASYLSYDNKNNVVSDLILVEESLNISTTSLYDIESMSIEDTVFLNKSLYFNISSSKLLFINIYETLNMKSFIDSLESEDPNFKDAIGLYYDKKGVKTLYSKEYEKYIRRNIEKIFKNKEINKLNIFLEKTILKEPDLRSEAYVLQKQTTFNILKNVLNDIGFLESKNILMILKMFYIDKDYITDSGLYKYSYLYIDAFKEHINIKDLKGLDFKINALIPFIALGLIPKDDIFNLVKVADLSLEDIESLALPIDSISHFGSLDENYYCFLKKVIVKLYKDNDIEKLKISLKTSLETPLMYTIANLGKNYKGISSKNFKPMSKLDIDFIIVLNKIGCSFNFSENVFLLKIDNSYYKVKMKDDSIYIEYLVYEEILNQDILKCGNEKLLPLYSLYLLSNLGIIELEDNISGIVSSKDLNYLALHFNNLSENLKEFIKKDKIYKLIKEDII